MTSAPTPRPCAPRSATCHRRLSADGGLTAAENLDFYARVTGVPRRERAARIASAVEAMELEPMLDRLARTLSGGMLRRLEIATALLNRPEVLFLDEPTVGLDPTARELVWERVHAQRADAGTTVVVTTHLMEEAERHCDRLAIMDAGRVVELGTPLELLERHGARSLEAVFRAVTGRALAEKGGSAMSAPSAASPVASAEVARPAALTGGPLRPHGRRHVGDVADRVAQAAPQPARLLTRSVQPLLWLFVFGTAMRNLRSIPTGGSTTAPTWRRV